MELILAYKNPQSLPKVVFNYLGQFNEAVQENNSLWEIIWEDAGSTIHPDNVSPHLLTINS